MSDTAPKKNAIIAVATGEGVAALRAMGVDYVIDGGQDIDPSVDDYFDALGALCADTIFVLPNSPHSLTTARRATSLIEATRILVVPTLTVEEGYAVLAAVDSMDGDPDVIFGAMRAALK